MKFSIILPAHNSEKFIRKALDSIHSQTYKDYELIVICDSCEDNTEEIARLYTAKVISVNYCNDGLTRNVGLDVAQGDWILFMDDDDWWLHEYVLEQLAEKLGDEDILCFSFIFKHWKYATPTGNDGNRWVAVWNKCWRRNFIGSTRFPAIMPNSDLYFHTAVFNKNPKIVDWDMPMYYYNYMHEGSLTWRLNGGK